MFQNTICPYQTLPTLIIGPRKYDWLPGQEDQLAAIMDTYDGSLTSEGAMARLAELHELWNSDSWRETRGAVKMEQIKVSFNHAFY